MGDNSRANEVAALNIEVPSCSICYNEYSSGIRKPWDLGCGHCICGRCFASLSFSGPKVCPVDRSEWNNPHPAYELLHVVEQLQKSRGDTSNQADADDELLPESLRAQLRIAGSQFAWRPPDPFRPAANALLLLSDVWRALVWRPGSSGSGSSGVGQVTDMGVREALGHLSVALPPWVHSAWRMAIPGLLITIITMGWRYVAAVVMLVLPLFVSATITMEVDFQPHSWPLIGACVGAGLLGSASALDPLLALGLLQPLLAALLLTALAAGMYHARMCNCDIALISRQRSVQLLVLASAICTWASGLAPATRWRMVRRFLLLLGMEFPADRAVMARSVARAAAEGSGMTSRWPLRAVEDVAFWVGTRIMSAVVGVVDVQPVLGRLQAVGMLVRAVSAPAVLMIAVSSLSRVRAALPTGGPWVLPGTRLHAAVATRYDLDWLLLRMVVMVGVLGATESLWFAAIANVALHSCFLLLRLVTANRQLLRMFRDESDVMSALNLMGSSSSNTTNNNSTTTTTNASHSTDIRNSMRRRVRVVRLNHTNSTTPTSAAVASSAATATATNAAGATAADATSAAGANALTTAVVFGRSPSNDILLAFAAAAAIPTTPTAAATNPPSEPPPSDDATSAQSDHREAVTAQPSATSSSRTSFASLSFPELTHLLQLAATTEGQGGLGTPTSPPRTRPVDGATTALPADGLNARDDQGAEQDAGGRGSLQQEQQQQQDDVREEVQEAGGGAVHRVEQSWHDCCPRSIQDPQMGPSHAEAGPHLPRELASQAAAGGGPSQQQAQGQAAGQGQGAQCSAAGVGQRVQHAEVGDGDCKSVVPRPPDDVWQGVELLGSHAGVLEPAMVAAAALAAAHAGGGLPSVTPLCSSPPRNQTEVAALGITVAGEGNPEKQLGGDVGAWVPLDLNALNGAGGSQVAATASGCAVSLWGPSLPASFSTPGCGGGDGNGEAAIQQGDTRLFEELDKPGGPARSVGPHGLPVVVLRCDSGQVGEAHASEGSSTGILAATGALETAMVGSTADMHGSGRLQESCRAASNPREGAAVADNVGEAVCHGASCLEKHAGNRVGVLSGGSPAVSCGSEDRVERPLSPSTLDVARGGLRREDGLSDTASWSTLYSPSGGGANTSVSAAADATAHDPVDAGRSACVNAPVGSGSTPSSVHTSEATTAAVAVTADAKQDPFEVPSGEHTASVPSIEAAADPRPLTAASTAEPITAQFHSGAAVLIPPAMTTYDSEAVTLAAVTGLATDMDAEVMDTGGRGSSTAVTATDLANASSATDLANASSATDSASASTTAATDPASTTATAAGTTAASSGPGSGPQPIPRRVVVRDLLASSLTSSSSSRLRFRITAVRAARDVGAAAAASSANGPGTHTSSSAAAADAAVTGTASIASGSQRPHMGGSRRRGRMEGTAGGIGLSGSQRALRPPPPRGSVFDDIVWISTVMLVAEWLLCVPPWPAAVEAVDGWMGPLPPGRLVRWTVGILGMGMVMKLVRLITKHTPGDILRPITATRTEDGGVGPYNVRVHMRYHLGMAAVPAVCLLLQMLWRPLAGLHLALVSGLELVLRLSLASGMAGERHHRRSTLPLSSSPPVLLLGMFLYERPTQPGNSPRLRARVTAAADSGGANIGTPCSGGGSGNEGTPSAHSAHTPWWQRLEASVELVAAALGLDWSLARVLSRLPATLMGMRRRRRLPVARSRAHIEA